MKIAVLSCFYPYRGGIAQFNANLYFELGKSDIVRAFNFTRQYPDILFPGKTQYVTPDDEAMPVESTATLDTANPISWARTAKMIREWQPDAIIYIMANLHVSEIKNNPETEFNNININDKNAASALLANGKDIFYLDCNPLFTDDNGFLNADLTFDANGKIVVSDDLSDVNQVFMNVDRNKILNMSEYTRNYMKYHCDNILK